MLLPKMYRVRQTFERPVAKDIKGAVEAGFRNLSLEKKVKPGQRVAIHDG